MDQDACLPYYWVNSAKERQELFMLTDQDKERDTLLITDNVNDYHLDRVNWASLAAVTPYHDMNSDMEKLLLKKLQSQIEKLTLASNSADHVNQRAKTWRYNVDSFMQNKNVSQDQFATLSYLDLLNFYLSSPRKDLILCLHWLEALKALDISLEQFVLLLLGCAHEVRIVPFTDQATAQADISSWLNIIHLCSQHHCDISLHSSYHSGISKPVTLIMIKNNACRLARR